MPRDRTAQPRLSKRNWLAILLPPLMLVLAIVLLRQAGVPLGQGSFRYLYTPLWRLRAAMLPTAFAGIGLLGWAVWLAGRDRLAAKPRVLATLGVLAMCAFGLLAIPHPVYQNQFNSGSLSHDGAFVTEALGAPSAGAYARVFAQRQQTSIQVMGGTRVLSNPPGVTYLALAVRAFWPEGFVESYVAEMLGIPVDDVARVGAFGLKVFAVLAAFWPLAAPAMYAAARRLLPPAPALAATAVAVFAPSCIEFAPGKDVAQVLISALILLGACLAFPAKNKAPGKPALGGAILGGAAATGVFSGLLMAWVALAAALWAALALRRQWPALLRFALGGGLGLVALGAAIYLATGYDIATGSLSVAAAFAKVQPQIAVDRATWYAIGLPLALLFAPAGAFSVLLLRARAKRDWTLLGITCATMLATYVLGVPYELPRLWAPFLPMLVLGAFLAAPLAHSPSRRAAHVLAIIAGLSMTAAVIHWAHLDPRESETRITWGGGVDRLTAP